MAVGRSSFRYRMVSRTAPLVLGAALVASACGSGGESTDADGESTPTIQLVTYSSFVLDPEVKAAAESELGISLELVSAGDAVEVINRAILSAGNPEGDVLFGVDDATMSRALASDVFAEHSLDLPSWAQAANGDAALQLAAIDTGAVCVDYDRGWFETNEIDPPETLADLTKPSYKDLLVVENPTTSSPGLAFLLATHAEFGDQADAYWQDLLSNGVLVVGSWDDAWGVNYSASGGDRPLVVSYASSPPAEVFYSEGELDEPLSGVATGTCFGQTEFGGVLDGTDHPSEAAALLEFMTQKQWQESLPLTNFVFPASPEAQLPEVFSEFAIVPNELLSLTPEEIDANQESWIEQWRSIVE